ncbi:MAG: hypothetical protein M0C28_40080 [Candidatus Moduliflexus flocculans]|nr:hypothetical protein [Candidatus Moduliflexus flocculans]
MYQRARLRQGRPADADGSAWSPAPLETTHFPFAGLPGRLRLSPTAKAERSMKIFVDLDDRLTGARLMKPFQYFQPTEIRFGRGPVLRAGPRRGPFRAPGPARHRPRGAVLRAASSAGPRPCWPRPGWPSTASTARSPIRRRTSIDPGRPRPRRLSGPTSIAGASAAARPWTRPRPSPSRRRIPAAPGTICSSRTTQPDGQDPAGRRGHDDLGDRVARDPGGRRHQPGRRRTSRPSTIALLYPAGRARRPGAHAVAPGRR